MTSYRFLHLSDLHLTATGYDEDGVDARSSLRDLLYDLRHLSNLSAVLVTGDIADDGSVAGYTEAWALLEPFARDRGIPVIVCTGNHDNRTAFASVLGSGHRGPDGSDVGRLMNPDVSRAAVSRIGGIRVITLDSLSPGERDGVLGADQLTWLAAELSDPAPDGTLVLLHHPPIRRRTEPVPDRLLTEAPALAAVVNGTDVRAVLAGHLHHQLSGFLGTVPVWVSPGVVTQIDLTAPEHLIRGLRGAGASVLELNKAGSPLWFTVHARGPHDPATVYLWDEKAGREVATEDS